MRRAFLSLLFVFLPTGLLAGSTSVHFMETRKHFNDLYGEEIRQTFGRSLQIQQDDENPLYFGGASLEKDRYVISVGRDILSLPSMTKDAQAYLLCHEIGHLLGGEPRKSEWASSEGQSDYFAAFSCLRKVFPHTQTVQKRPHPVLKEACQKRFSKSASQQECERIGTAGEALIEAIYVFMDVPQMIKPDFSTPAAPNTIGKKINYPTLQCRLDTVLAGALLQERPACF